MQRDTRATCNEDATQKLGISLSECQIRGDGLGMELGRPSQRVIENISWLISSNGRKWRCQNPMEGIIAAHACRDGKLVAVIFVITLVKRKNVQKLEKINIDAVRFLLLFPIF